MRAAVLTGIRSMEVVDDWPEPQLQPGKVKVRIRSVGVCGSDVHYYKNGRIGSQVVSYPFIIGHECSGEVVEVGAGVTGFAPGDRVAMEPGIACGTCPRCREGRYNICPQVKFLGTPPVEGAYREFAVYDPLYLHQMPDNLSYAEGAMVEPFSVGVWAAEYAGVRNGDRAVVLGCGSIGLSVLQAVRAAGAHRLLATDRLDYRLQVAARLGADLTVNTDKGGVEESVAAMTDGFGADVVFEAAGKAEAFEQACRLLRPGGTLVLIGICEEEQVSLNFDYLRRREVLVRPLRRFRGTYPTSLEMISLGKASVDAFVTHTFPLEQVVEAFDLVEGYRDGVIKAVIEI